jgi:plastocyanin
VLVVAAGCEHVDDHAASPTAATSTADGTAVVALVDHLLVEAEIEVPAGGSVRWENHDPGEHELVALTGDVIRSPVLGQAASYTARFEAPGEYPYYCNIHNYMKGTVVVR